MVLHPSLDIAYDSFEPDGEDSRETLLALGNGALTLRGCAPWAVADGTHYPGTYRAGCYARVESVAEGERVVDESIVNLPNPLPLNLWLEGESEWFSLAAFEILSYRHALEAEPHTTVREVVARDRLGRRTRLKERRLVSMARAEIAAFRLEVTAEDWSGSAEIRSGVDGAIINDRVGRYRPFSRRRFDVLRRERVDSETLLVTARAHGTGAGIAVAVRTRVQGATPGERRFKAAPATITDAFHCALPRGRVVAIEKVAAIVTNGDSPDGAAEAALAALRAAPDFAALEAEHTRAWQPLAQGVNFTAEEPQMRDAAAYHAFQLLQTFSPHSRALDAGFPARGWQEAYHAHIFWDELFVFPFLAPRLPELTRGLVEYRLRRLEAARSEARAHGMRGAMFPWRSAASGRGVTPGLQINPLSGRFMRDHTRLQWHIGAAVARNAWHHWAVTGDDGFLAAHGAGLLAEIARFFASAARHDAAEDRYDLHGIVGPDEYHSAYLDAERPGLDTNAYTNVMVAWTLRHALEALDRLPEARRRALRDTLGLGGDEIAVWERMGTRMKLCFHGDGLLAQFAGFDRLRPVDPQEAKRRHRGKRLDWLLEARGETADAYQLIKQPDTMMLLHLLGEEELSSMVNGFGYALDEAAIRRTVEHDLARTAHASSLSDAVCAGALARLDPARSWTYFRETLHPSDDPATHSSAAEGLHLGTMAGMLDVLQRHYLGLRLEPDAIHLAPAVPEALRPVRMAFRCRFGGFALEWTGQELRLHAEKDNTAPAPVLHRGGRESLRPGSILIAAGR